MLRDESKTNNPPKNNREEGNDKQAEEQLVSDDPESKRLGMRYYSEHVITQPVESAAVPAAVGSERWLERNSTLTNVIACFVIHVSEGRISQTK